MLVVYGIDHAVGVKKTRDRRMQDIFVNISPHDQVVPCIYPFLQFLGQVFFKRYAWMSVIVFALQVSFVLGMDRDDTIDVVTGLIDADYSQSRTVFSSISSPGPSSKACSIGTCAHTIMGEFAV